jgi:polysaccharide biosynthesis transport protein
MVAESKPSGEESECFRTLRASLLLKEDIRQSRVLMITSSGPGDGKSLVASNLAISLAQDGRRVLLVGCDLRRPVLNKIFSMDSGYLGLSDVLKGRAAWPDALQRQTLPNLDLLNSGEVPSQPSELLGKRAFADFLAESREFYDHVIVDAPPVLGVSDALVLLPNMDGVLFVVRYGVTHSLGAKHAIMKMQASGTPCLGCIMNGVNLKSLANYYYYRRYGGYTYQQYQNRASQGGEPVPRADA